MRTLYFNGKVYLGEGEFSDRFIVDQDKYLVEDDASWDQSVDLEGRVVLPGLNDSHLHMNQMGQHLRRVNLNVARSIEDILELTKKFIKEHPPTSGFIYGRGWNQDYFTSGEDRLPDRHDLDSITTEYPLMLERVCGHITVLNTKCLEYCGITKDTMIDGGEIRLGEDGEPNGILTENALNYAREFIPKYTEAEVKEKLTHAMDRALSMGITSIGSADYYIDTYEMLAPMICDLYKNKEHPLRYDPQFNFHDFDKFMDYYERFYTEDGAYNDYYSKGALKLFKDGSLGGRTALMRKPYHDDPSTVGVSAISRDYVEKCLRFCEEKGMRMIVHCIGDGAIEELIEVITECAAPGNPNRHAIVHNQITDLDQLERIAKANIYVYYQPVFLEYDILITEDRVGKDLAKTSYAFKTMQELGPHLVSYGTDAPVEDFNPWENIYHAVTRKRQDGSPEGGFYPEEKVSVEKAIDAYTYGGAYATGHEKVKGLIKTGYLADFVVLDKDIFTCSEDEIKEIRPVQTFIGGELVYERKGSA